MESITDVEQFRDDLNRECRILPHGTLLFGDVVLLHRSESLDVALRDFGITYSGASGKINRVSIAVRFLRDHILTESEKELFDSTTMDAAGMNFKSFRYFRQIAITCILTGRTDALKELAGFSYNQDSIDAWAMYAYLESGSDLPYSWWLSLNPDATGKRDT